MTCRKLCISFTLLLSVYCSLRLHAMSASFAPVYATIGKLDSQVQELNLNLMTQQALSLQLQAQLSKSQQDLALSQQDLETANQQLEQSKTTLAQASKDAETLNRQLKSSEASLKIWRGIAIAATPIAIVSTTALIITLIHK